MIAYFKQKIAAAPEQRISFYEYMSDCLYHPQYGYYMKQKQKIGKRGDYYTSSYVHSVFAETIMEVAVQIFQARKEKMYFCELGAGTGLFARQFLDALQKKYPEQYEQISYWLIEKSPFHQQQQQQQLERHLKKVSWREGVAGLKGYQGILFSNELLDAFPVYLIEKRQNQLWEIGVAWSDEEQALKEVSYPLENGEIHHYLNRFQFSLEEGQRMEIPLDTWQWAKDVGRVCQEGLWITIDYGYTMEELKLPQHRGGSLLCYHQHKLDQDPLLMPGEKDITYHIHFDAIRLAGKEEQWSKLGYFSQADFLQRAGMLSMIQQHQGGDPFTNEIIRRNRAIMQFISPEAISASFQVLVLAKGSYAAVEYPFLTPFSFATIVSKQNVKL